MEKMIFKAWHKERKQMYWFDLFWGNHGHGDGYIGMVELGLPRETDNRHNGNQVNIDPHDCEILRPTGLKDKSGKEIYEGDIVKRTDELAIVFFNTSMGAWDFELIGGDCEPMVLVDGWHPEAHEIISNIYENPELLNN